MPLIEVLCPGSDVVGVRWHKPSEQYVAEVGYHRFNHVAADGTITTRRIRTTHYLGNRRHRDEAEAQFAEIKEDWKRCVAEQRKVYDEAMGQRPPRPEMAMPRMK